MPEPEAGVAEWSTAPFAKWTDQPYTIISAKTIEVGGMPVQVEVSADGQTLRAAGGTKVLNCKKAEL